MIDNLIHTFSYISLNLALYRVNFKVLLYIVIYKKADTPEVDGL